MAYGFKPREDSLAVQRSKARVAAIEPGTRYADPTQNIGAIRAGESMGTPKGIWDQQFKPRRSATGSLSNEFRATGDIGQWESSFAAAAEPAAPSLPGGFSFSAGGQPKLDTLPTLGLLASGAPPKSTDVWGGGMLSGQQPNEGGTFEQKKWAGSGGSKWSENATPLGSLRNVKSKYGWGSSFLPT